MTDDNGAVASKEKPELKLPSQVDPAIAEQLVEQARTDGVDQGVPDNWGAPDERGFLRDDNSLIKGLPKSLSVSTPTAGPLARARMGNEFVASHVWRVVDHADLASRLPLLNSFVPNLVWLPAQVSKLSDREGSAVQGALQAMAWQIYRDAQVARHLQSVVEDAWALIPEPTTTVDVPALNMFEPTSQFYSTRRKRLDAVIRAFDRLRSGLDLDEKVVTTRYTEGLPSLTPNAQAEMLSYLTQFVEADLL